MSSTPTISISPTGTNYYTTNGVVLSVNGCSPLGASFGYGTFKLNGVDITSQFNQSGSSFDCQGSWYSWDSNSITLSSGGNTFTAFVCDGASNCSATASATLIYYTPMVTRVEASPSSLALRAGATFNVSVQALDQYTQLMSGQTFTWSSTNSSVVSVPTSNASSITVTAGLADTASIVVADGSKSDTIPVTVTLAGAAAIHLASDNNTIPVGGVASLTATVVDSGGNPLTGSSVTWSHSSATVGGLSSSGMTASDSGRAPGIDVVKVKLASDTMIAAFDTVTVLGPVTHVVATEDSVTVGVGVAVEVHATARDTNNAIVPWATFTWQMQNNGSGIATLDGPSTVDSAKIVGVSVAVTYVTVTSNGKKDSVVVAVTSTGGGGLSNNLYISTRAINPDSALARDRCLTIAAGDGGAYECGDLRLGYALPATRTFGVSRTPTLVYSSRAANASAVIAANVTLIAPSSPTALVARVQVDSATFVDTLSWNAACLNSTCRITMPVSGDSLPQTTPAVHHYTFQVSTIGGTAYTKTDSGVVIIVDRRTSPYGRGWWVDGLEQLSVIGGDTTNLLWVGGDGSARIYTRTAPTDSTWVATNVDHPDTLVRLTSGSYRRWLPRQAYVQFDSLMRHSSTVNRLGQAANFHYLSIGRVDSILVPVPSSAATLAYVFHYSKLSNNIDYGLDSVSAPTISGLARTIAVRHDNATGDLLSLQDPGPDTMAVQFRYAATSVTRLNRFSDSTRYNFDTGGGLASMVQYLNRTNSGVTYSSFYCPQETTGRNGCGGGLIPWTHVSTLLQGPRTDVTDTTRFWVNRYGAPYQVTDAQGHVTAIDYDATWPGLVASLTDPLGHRTTATYDARGNLLTQTDHAPYAGDTTSAVSSYTYSSNTDFLTTITNPEGDSVTFTVDSIGNRLTQQDGRGSTSQVSFAYGSGSAGPAKNMLVRVTRPGSTKDSLVYDALGNVDSARTALGYWSSTISDGIGRPVVAHTPVDSAGTAFRKDSTVYDAMDRAVDVFSMGPAMIDSLGTSVNVPISAETLHVQTVYDLESRPLDVTRWALPDSGASYATSSFHYDALGRRTYSDQDHGLYDSLTYDPSGNVITRHRPSGATITFAFDVLNQLQSRVVPGTSTDSADLCMWDLNDLGLCGPTWNINRTLPVFGDTIHVPADTATFAYDALGRLTEADNYFARITRTWHPNGALLADTTRIRVMHDDASPSDPFAKHVYGLRHVYDLDGRQTELVEDTSIVKATCSEGQTRSGGCAQSFHYTSDAGFLDQVTDPWGNTYGFMYDAKGRVVARTAPGSVVDSSFYDADDRVTSRVERGHGGVVNLDTYHRDAPGRIIWAHAEDAGQAQYFHHAYDGLGATVATQTQLTSESAWPDVEAFQVNALGNVAMRTYVGSSGDSSSATPDYGGVALQLLGWNGSPGHVASSAITATMDSSHASYDADGNRADQWVHHYVADSLVWDQVSRSYYGADGTLRFFARRGTEAHRESAPRQDEYWYDALGRRVLVRSMADTTNGTYAESLAPSTITRSVWDGNTLVAEFQGIGTFTQSHGTLEIDGTGSSPVSNQQPYGSIVYVEGGLDAPLAFRRTVSSSDHVIVPHTNYRGLYDDGTTSSGAAADVDIVWPGNNRRTYGELITTMTGVGWAGSIVPDYQGESGLQYKRNRYYDPATGKFTQLDPIGLAGGSNLYGYANGDPINTADPFGLCPYTGDHTTDVSDCPKDDVGNAFRLLKSDGGREGESTILLVSANHENVKVESGSVVQQHCPDSPTGCNRAGVIYLETGQSVVDNATRLTHEATHLMGFDYDTKEEPLAWRRALTVWRRFEQRLPAAAMSGSWYKQWSDACAAGLAAPRYCPGGSH